MKRLTYLIIRSLPLLLLCLLGGCKDNDGLPEGNGTEAGSISFVFSVNNELKSRTALPGSDNLQHVESVHLYIFAGTGDDAQCVASEDVGWQEYFGTLPTATAQMTYTVKYKGFIAGTPFTFLAVGMDDESGATYDFPGAINNGTTLSAAIASLATGKGCSDIARSELFAGSTVLTPTESGVTGKVELYRRVAGVMGWFTNVPAEVKKIQIKLYKKQNTQVPLIPREQTPVFLDYLDSPTADTDGETLVSITAAGGETTTVSGGSYVLPVPAPEVPQTDTDTKYTLKVVLLDATDATVNTLNVKLVPDNLGNGSGTGSGTGIIDTDGAYRFPIVANQFYGLGSKDAPIDLTINTYITLTITVNHRWDHIYDIGLSEK